MLAILSDVHANLEALQAVLEDIGRHRVGAIYCLGDTLGYGPNPRECLDLVAAKCTLILLGNHDQAVLLGPVGFREHASRAVHWTQAQLQAPVLDAAAEARWHKFLTDLPSCRAEEDVLYVHGSPRDPLNEYIFPAHVQAPFIMADLFTRVRRCCFQGHTHVPGIFSEQVVGFYEFRPPQPYQLGGCKSLVNVGSVGQPRDGDWRACYVLFDGETVHFRRVAYDVDTTVRKIHATQGLDAVLGDRLRDGR
jgi:diadenosine tetraphosphatase ApaH/serine/threonine PP2A family protein phosphatase